MEQRQESYQHSVLDKLNEIAGAQKEMNAKLEAMNLRLTIVEQQGSKLTDHESRLRTMEVAVNSLSTKAGSIGAIFGIVGGALISAIINMILTGKGH